MPPSPTPLPFARRPLASAPPLPLLLGCACGLVAPAFSPCLAQWDEDDPTLDRNRLQVNARFAFNVSAEIRTVQTASATVPPVFDDGFVLPDVNGGADNQTWYWGYEHADQVAEGSLALHSTQGSALDGSSLSLDNDPQPGFEVIYGRVLGFLNLPRDRKMPWGVQFGFGALDMGMEDSQTGTGNVLLRTDTYPLGEVIPPLAPYSGTFDGPGPLLSLTPSSSTTLGVPAQTTLNARLESLLMGFKIGPFIEYPISQRFGLQFSAGGIVTHASAKLTFQETTLLEGRGYGPASRDEEYDEHEWIYGYYASLTASYALNYNIGVFLGVQYQSLGDLSVAGGGKEAELDLGGRFEVLLGVRASF